MDNKEDNNEEELTIMEKLKLKTYYIIIGCVSFIALCIMPFIGGAEGGITLPHGKAQWLVWIFNRIIVTALNVAIFYCFVQQGHVNSLNNESYKKAVDILLDAKDNSVKEARSPKQFLSGEYIHKGASVLISTLTASFALTQILIDFDLASMISYFIVIFMGLIFGVLEMKKVEEYWQEEFYKYALKVQKEVDEARQFEIGLAFIKKNVAKAAEKIMKEESNV